MLILLFAGFMPAKAPACTLWGACGSATKGNSTLIAKNRDWKQLAKTAHQLKGAAGSYGFDEITPYVARLEAALRETQQEDQILSALDELVTLCRRVRAGKPQADETPLNTAALAGRS